MYQEISRALVPGKFSDPRFTVVILHYTSWCSKLSGLTPGSKLLTLLKMLLTGISKAELENN